MGWVRLFCGHGRQVFRYLAVTLLLLWRFIECVKYTTIVYMHCTRLMQPVQNLCFHVYFPFDSICLPISCTHRTHYKLLYVGLWNVTAQARVYLTTCTTIVLLFYMSYILDTNNKTCDCFPDSCLSQNKMYISEITCTCLLTKCACIKSVKSLLKSAEFYILV